MTDTKNVIQLPNSQSAIVLAGDREQNLTLIAKSIGSTLLLRGQELFISGTPQQIEQTSQVIKLLKPFWTFGKKIALVDIRTVIQAIQKNKIVELQALQESILATTRKGEEIRAKTLTQWNYIQLVKSYDLTFCIGPAGTGKTFLAAVLGVQSILQGNCDRLILTRPAVEAGEKLGFLPGDIQAKVNPYLRPLYDALYEFIEPEKIPNLMERGIIEVAPLAYMRGRTLNNAFVIVDEAQNITSTQMKMLLTRLGFGSRMVITGDITQTDLPSYQTSGLITAQKILKGVEGIAFCFLNKSDVVRHPLVEKIVAAYEKEEPTIKDTK